MLNVMATEAKNTYTKHVSPYFDNILRLVVFLNGHHPFSKAISKALAIIDRITLEKPWSIALISIGKDKDVNFSP